jgi:hypothetical protein
MIRIARSLAAVCLLVGTADGAPRRASPAAGVLVGHALSRFTQELIERERGFFRAGVAYDGETGMTFDGHPIDPVSGKLTGSARPWSAASKESLHLILLVKALEGDPTARALLTPDPRDPQLAVGVALDVLRRKIAAYRQFDRDYPGYGGFLPWYKVEHGKVAPTDGWTDRVPGLDNGELAWSLYRARDVLERLGHPELALEYAAQLDLMKKNVVRLFYDPVEHKMRAETRLVAGNLLAPMLNRYENSRADHFLDDPYEGLLLCHFADLFGDWEGQVEGKELIWKEPRRRPATYGKGALRISVVEGNWFSSHEEWGFLVLPFRDVQIADRLFVNAQKARTAYSASHGWPGLFASTNAPAPDGTPGYLSALGVPSIARAPVSAQLVFAPYAAFPLALVDKPMFATWMRRILRTPRMWGECGIGESFRPQGNVIAPLLTWDGKALPLVAMMGGISGDIAAQMKRDGVYHRFIERVRADYRNFDGERLRGDRLSLRAPARR